MPTNGTANYKGSTLGFGSNGTSPFVFTGLAQMSVNFATNTVSSLQLTNITTQDVNDNNPGPAIANLTGTGAIVGKPSLTKIGSTTSTVTIGTANTSLGAVSITNGVVQLGTSSGLATMTSLSIGASGKFDVNNNHIIINYGSGADPIASIAALLATGYNGGAWNGAGIVSSTAAASGGRYGVGFAEENELQVPGLSAGQAEIAYALYGDCNLDGVVNGIDFGIIAANFNKGFANDGWEDGDFDYNGVINGSDFALFAANFNKGASGTDIAALNAFAAQNNIILSVPEPAIASLLIAATATVGSRRRRRTKLLISSP
jgi:hypothetical protein